MGIIGFYGPITVDRISRVVWHGSALNEMNRFVERGTIVVTKFQRMRTLNNVSVTGIL